MTIKKNKTIHENLLLLEGYLLSIEFNTESENFELLVGLSKDWVYKSTELIECEEIKKVEDAILLKVRSKNNKIIIDDLINYVCKIVETNERILKMKEEFDEKLKSTRKQLEDEAENFQIQLKNFKESSLEYEPEQEEKEIKEKDKTNYIEDKLKK